jgi:hypothetical protein
MMAHNMSLESMAYNVAMLLEATGAAAYRQYTVWQFTGNYVCVSISVDCSADPARLHTIYAVPLLS